VIYRISLWLYVDKLAIRSINHQQFPHCRQGLRGTNLDSAHCQLHRMSQRKTPWNALSLSEDRHSNCAICGSLTIFDLEITGRKAQICSSCSARITVLITLKSGRQTTSWDNLTTCWGLYSFLQKLGTSNLSDHWFPHVNPTSQFDGMGIVSNSMNVPCQYELWSTATLHPFFQLLVTWVRLLRIFSR
jgi:hypothetical protein